MKTLIGIVILVCGLASLSGCVTRGEIVWYKSGATIEQFEKDKQQAMLEAVKFGYVSHGINPFVSPLTQGFSDLIETSGRRREIFEMEMKTRGYRRCVRRYTDGKIIDDQRGGSPTYDPHEAELSPVEPLKLR